MIHRYRLPLPTPDRDHSNERGGVPFPFGGIPPMSWQMAAVLRSAFWSEPNGTVYIGEGVGPGH